MILYLLKCTSDHRFETWFRNSAAYDALAAAHAISCPVCGDTRIAKAPMAPRIAKGRGGDAEAPQPPAQQPPAQAAPGAPGALSVPAAPHPAGQPAGELPMAMPGPALPEEVRERLATEIRNHLTELRKAVESSCDYVGDRFAEEARRIHYGETDARGIYGEASASQAEELIEEGVTIQRIPWLPRTNS